MPIDFLCRKLIKLIKSLKLKKLNFNIGCFFLDIKLSKK